MPATVTVTADMPASADAVWKTASPHFCGIGEFHPALASCALSQDDALRTLTLKGGGVIVERRTNWDDAGRTYSYVITESPLPVSNYGATFAVAENGDDASTVTWSAEFDPVGDEGEAKKVITGIFESGLEALKAKF